MKSSLSMTIAGQRGHWLGSHPRAPRRESALSRRRRTPLPAGRPFCLLARLLTLLAGTASLVVAEAAAPGQVLWTFTTGGQVSGSPAMGADGTVYVGSRVGKVYALNGATGIKRWEVLTGGPVTAALAVGADGTVYASANYRLLALDGETGQLRWEYPAGGELRSSPAISADGTVLIHAEFRVHGLDGATGRRLWAIDAYSRDSSTPTIGSDGTVYVSYDRKVQALHGATGQGRWGVEIGGTGAMALGADGTVYVGSSAGTVYALDGETGQERWRFRTAGAAGLPAIGEDGTVYLGSWGAADSRLYALEGATGRMRWEFRTGGGVHDTPAIGSDGTVFVTAADKHLYALDGATGQKRWEFRAEAGLDSDPAIGGDGTVYIGAVGGEVYALGSASAQGLARSPWPKFQGDARNTGQARFPATPARITVELAGLRVPVGTHFSLWVSASGSPPLAFQWHRAGQAIPGATARTLEVDEAQLAAAGDYQVTVANALGSVTSLVAQVVVGYTLNLTASGGGAVQATPALEVYDPGQTVEVAAVPGPGRTFLGWQGDAAGASSPLRVTLDRAKEIQALFSALPGDLKWKSTTGGTVASCPAIGADGTVYVGAGDGKVYAFSGRMGQKRWEFQTGSNIVASPAIGPAGAVFLGSLDGVVYALEGTTGQRLWAYRTGGPVAASAAVGADGTVFVGSNDKRVYALEGTTGRVVWTYQAEAEVVSPAIGLDGNVYVSSGTAWMGTGAVDALDGSTGQRVWHYATGGAVASPAIGSDGTVYVVTTELLYTPPPPPGGGQMEVLKVHALDGATGQVWWVSRVDNDSGRDAPAIGPGGTMLLGSSGSRWSGGCVYALGQATGGMGCWFPNPGPVPGSYSCPALGADGTVYVGSSSRLHALAGADAALLWEFQPVTWEAPLSAPALGADGTVYVGAGAAVYALAGSSGLAPGPWPKLRGDARNTGRTEVLAVRPWITHQPADVRVAVGESFTLAVVARGIPPPAFQWHVAGEAIPGATASTLRVDDPALDAGGGYYVTVSNSEGSVTSRVAQVVVGYGLVLTTRPSGTVERRPSLSVYEPGQVVELTAIPQARQRFLRWEGDAQGVNNPLTLTMDGSKEIIAVFSFLPGDLVWEFAPAGGGFSSPAIGVDGSLYLGASDQRLYALDGRTGQRLWEVETGGRIESAPAVAPDGTVYVVPNNRTLCAVSGATHLKLWEFQNGTNELSATAIGADGTVYVGCQDGKVYALHGRTGLPLWEYRTGGAVRFPAAIGADGTLYVPSADGKLQALDGRTGRQAWEFTGAADAALSSPAIGHGGIVYVGSNDGQLRALSGATGEQLWAVSNVLSTLAIGADGTLYVGRSGTGFVALEGATGQRRWKLEGSELTGPGGSRNTVFPASPVVGTDGAVYVASHTHECWWEWPMRWPECGEFLGLQALDAATGQGVWSRFLESGLPPSAASSAAMGADGTVYVVVGGTLRALHSASVGGLAASPWPKFRGDAQNTGRVSSPALLRLTIVGHEEKVRLEWTPPARLQSSDELGPSDWQDVSDAASPYDVEPANTQRFYRLRRPRRGRCARPGGEPREGWQAKGLHHRSRGQRPRATPAEVRALRGRTNPLAGSLGPGLARPLQGAERLEGAGSKGDALGYDGSRPSGGGHGGRTADEHVCRHRPWHRARSRKDAMRSLIITAHPHRT